MGSKTLVMPPLVTSNEFVKLVSGRVLNFGAFVVLELKVAFVRTSVSVIVHAYAIGAVMPLVETASAFTVTLELKPTSYQVVCATAGVMEGTLIVIRMDLVPIPRLLNRAVTRSFAAPWKLAGMGIAALLTVSAPTKSELLRTGKLAFQPFALTVALPSTVPGLVTIR